MFSYIPHCVKKTVNLRGINIVTFTLRVTSESWAPIESLCKDSQKVNTTIFCVINCIAAQMGKCALKFHQQISSPGSKGAEICLCEYVPPQLVLFSALLPPK